MNMAMIIVSTLSHIFHSRMYFDNCGAPRNVSATCLEKTLDLIREEVTDSIDIIAIGERNLRYFSKYSLKVNSFIVIVILLNLNNGFY